MQKKTSKKIQKKDTAKSVAKSTTKNKPWIILSAALGATALTFTGLFIWKAATPAPMPIKGSHKVTWVDDNDKVLEVDRVMDGEMPEYNGENPASYDTEIDESGEKYRYVFNGWNHDLVPVTEDVTYKAVMKAHSLVTKIVLNTPEDDDSVYRYFDYAGELEKVDWGDGTVDKNVVHAYDSTKSQKVTIRIYGEITQLYLAYDYCAFDGIYASRGIESVHLSYSITSIPGASMYDINTVSQLPTQKIFIPSSVRRIESEAFSISLSGGTVMDVEFEEGMELDYIGEQAFQNNEGGSSTQGFVNFTFGKNIIIHDIYYEAFMGNCSSLNFLDGTQIDHISSEAFERFTVNTMSFGNNCRLGDLNLHPNEINLPHDIQRITFGDNCYIHAFNYIFSPTGVQSNNTLEYISFGDNCYVETLGSFYGYQNLKGIQFGKNSFVKNINTDYMFNACNSLVFAILPETVGSELGDGTFFACTNLSYISLPKNIKYIPAYFMNHSYSITSIIIPRSVEFIGAYAFDDTYLEEVIFEEGSCLKQIGLSAFENNYNSDTLSIELPEGLEVIQADAFYQSQALTEIKIPKSVKTIGACTFCGCGALSSIEFAEGSNLISLGEYTLQSTDIKTLVLPDKLEYIGYQLCASCNSLEYVKLPASLKHLGYQAFEDCQNLTTADLTALTELPVVDSGNPVFVNCDQSKLTIYVSSQKVYDELTSTEGKAVWGDFTVSMEVPPQPEI